MRIRLTLGIRCLPIIPCTAGRIRTRGTPLARKLPGCSLLLRDVAHHARAWELTKHPFRSALFTLPTYPQGAIRAAAYQNPCKQPVASALLLCNCLRRKSRRFRFSRRLISSSNKSAVKNKAIASNPERSAKCPNIDGFIIYQRRISVKRQTPRQHALYT